MPDGTANECVGNCTYSKASTANPLRSEISKGPGISQLGQFSIHKHFPFCPATYGIFPVYPNLLLKNLPRCVHGILLGSKQSPPNFNFGEEFTSAECLIKTNKKITYQNTEIQHKYRVTIQGKYRVKNHTCF
jgi:hypothetical protein